jgi:hypothetical protein
MKRSLFPMRTIASKAIWVCYLSMVGLAAAGSSDALLTLPQEAYVWQRAWTPAVRKSVELHRHAFAGLILLAGEISWKNSHPMTTRISLPYDTLRQQDAPIGLALRINSFAGPFSEADGTATALAKIAASILEEARTNGIVVRELQIDFDCAESKLSGYEQWIHAVKKNIGSVPLTITALPIWLNRLAFHHLAAATDGYVLQVHSLRRPESYDAPFTLCDPDEARTAVAKAVKIGVPFWVALPTYGYVLAFAPDGQFVGLSAEGPSKSWPAKARLRAVEADPLTLAPLVREWAAQRPAAMRGVIWYRLPNADDTLNWRWPTLDAMLQLRSPRENGRAQTRRVEAGLYEISLINQGDLDISSRLAVDVHWQDARVVADDGLRGFEFAEGSEGTSPAATLQSKRPVHLRAGDTWTIGWIRFNKDTEVKLELRKR